MTLLQKAITAAERAISDRDPLDTRTLEILVEVVLKVVEEEKELMRVPIDPRVNPPLPHASETEPRTNEWMAPDGYWAYHELVIAEVRKRLLARGTPRTFKERDSIAMAVRFFDVECTYDDEFSRGDDPAEVAENNIDAADWE